MTGDPHITNRPVITTPDGSRTAHNARFGEAYGSRHGASTQAHHVFVNGTDTATHPAPRVLEVGFGVGVNFRATLNSAAQRGVPLTYVAYEFDPAPVQVLKEVARGQEGAEHAAWLALLQEWEAASDTPRLIRSISARSISGHPSGLEVVHPVSLTVHFANVLSADLGDAWASAIYLDGFSPARNPEVWTPEFVARLAGALAPGGIIGTYSAAGHVRRAMQDAGLHVQRRPGAPGKRECLRALKVV